MAEEKKKMWEVPEAVEEHILERMSGRIKNSLSGMLRVLLVALFVMAQFALVLWLPVVLQQYTVYFYVILEFASLIVILSLVNDVRSPAYKIAWITICLALPLSGELMFLLWGKTDSNKKIDKKLRKIMEHGEQYKTYNTNLSASFKEMYPYGQRMSAFLETEGFPLTKNNNLKYFPMGEDVFEQLLLDLEKAERYIFLNFFIVAEGALWDAVHEVCLRKINAGVEVKFIFDDFGAMLRTDKDFANVLRKEGFEVAVFNPIQRYTDKLYMNFRTHQKCVVIDGDIGYTGGFNIADEYANLVQRFGVWKDIGIRVEGDAVWWMVVSFLQMWEITTEKICIDFESYKSKKKHQENSNYCHVITDGPLNNPDNPIEMLYGQMIHYAQKYLYIMTPYLIIEKDMQDALITAVKSGVDVRIVTPYIPDKKAIKLVTNYNYGYLLENGVKIFEYLPGFIHAKCIINENFGVIGSINMDYRSFYLHYENGIWLADQETIEVMRKDFDDLFAISKEITYEEWLSRPLGMKIWQAILNLFATLL